MQPWRCEERRSGFRGKKRIKKKKMKNTKQRSSPPVGMGKKIDINH
jgi:hypothetical protein